MIGEAAKDRSACARGIRARMRFRAFTIVEVLIVVTVLGILAMVVIPQFSVAGQQDRQNKLIDELQYLRTQIAVFKAQHQDVPPGYPGGDPLRVPDPEAFLAQMLRHSDINIQLSASGGASFPYGPYLGKAPVNPINNLSTIKMVGNNQPMPRPDGTTGWIYKPQTQEIIANVANDKGSGIDYSKY